MRRVLDKKIGPGSIFTATCGKFHAQMIGSGRQEEKIGVNPSSLWPPWILPFQKRLVSLALGEAKRRLWNHPKSKVNRFNSATSKVSNLQMEGQRTKKGWSLTWKKSKQELVKTFWEGNTTTSLTTLVGSSCFLLFGIFHGWRLQTQVLMRLA